MTCYLFVLLIHHQIISSYVFCVGNINAEVGYIGSILKLIEMTYFLTTLQKTLKRPNWKISDLLKLLTTSRFAIAHLQVLDFWHDEKYTLRSKW